MQPGDTVYYYIENFVNGKFIPKLINGKVINKSCDENRIVVKTDRDFRVFSYSDIGRRLFTEAQKQLI